MKRRNIITFVVLINIIIIYKLVINNNNVIIGKQVIKEMSESTQVTDLNNQINALNTEHTEYMNYIQTCKTAIATALTNQKVTTSENATLETMAENIEKILEARTSDATATADNITEGKTAYVNGTLITGNGKDSQNSTKTVTVTLKNTSSASGTLQTNVNAQCSSSAQGIYTFNDVESYIKISGTATDSLSNGTLIINTSASQTNTGMWVTASTSTEVVYSITFK